MWYYFKMTKITKAAQDESDTKRRAEIARIATEVLEDPDFGRELSDEAKKRLRAARNSKRAIPLSEIKEKHL
jgi:hypothetical protein